MTFKLEKINVSAEDLEQLGTKEKFWFNYPKDPKHRFLFKFSRENTGEHWSEKVAEQLCVELGIPHVSYEMAITGGRYGIVTPNVIPENCRMVMGNEVLHKDSPHIYPNVSLMRVKEHTVSRVLGVLDKQNYDIPPSDYDLTGLSAADVFCGYLMLDALISNQDRHHENWAIILNNETGKKSLCPTYDHAASLGRELTDKERLDRLTSKDKGRQVCTFVRRARSELFKLKSDKKPMFTVEAFYFSVSDRERAKLHWLSKLEELTDDKIKEIFSKIPNTVISEHARQFSCEMVLENKKRLLQYEK
ncbi:hypothetical protein F0224_10970 [Vibrio coralliilyticus]|uniref:hypothetical protein n=1 Tax=Vibrio coralliilyticus TaxID=190893 RepID=UPI000BAC1956|nr:hypothetical protein [Vibrio coralliilyticus]NOI76202.1 hypothetical protein [Vibrio coralliilyticus]PAW00973.1 hypothetical protein CKJ79_24300 [Vibrio coralliilyticus]